MSNITNETLSVIKEHCNETIFYEFTKNYVYWTITDIVLMLIILSGNIVTIAAVTFTKQLAKRTSNKCILNLAISDLVVGLTLPYHISFYISENLRSGRETCLMKFCLIILACSASIVNIIIVAVDRYIAILYPLHYSKYMSKMVFRILMVIGWLSSIIVSIIPIFWNDWRPNILCDMHKVIPKTYSMYVLTPLFSIMWFIMLIVYWKIWREVVLHMRRMKTATCNSSIKNDWKSLQVVLLIMGCFTICWIPYVVVVCIQVINSEKFSLILYMTLFSLAKANSGINPIIYAWKNRGFRTSILRLIRCKNPNIRDLGQKLKSSSLNSNEEKNKIKTVSEKIRDEEI